MLNRILLILVIFLVQPASAQTCRDNIAATTPDARFSVNGDEVTDTATGLIWQRCSLGQTGTACDGGSAAGYTWQQALQTAENVRLSTGNPWRLPNVKELRSIVEAKCYSPAINLQVFPNTKTSHYWSGSPNASTRTARGMSLSTMATRTTTIRATTTTFGSCATDSDFDFWILKSVEPVGWVEERGMVHGCTGYGAEDANPACEMAARGMPGIAALHPAYAKPSDSAKGLHPT